MALDFSSTTGIPEDPAETRNVRMPAATPILEPGVPSSPQTALSSNDLEDIERATIQRVFEQVNGDKVMAGKMLGISRATLYRKLKRYNIGSHPDIAAASPRLQ